MKLRICSFALPVALSMSMCILTCSLEARVSKHTPNLPIDQHSSSSHSSHAVPTKHTRQRKVTALEAFARPVTFSRSSVKRFIKQTYNHNTYGQKFLAFNFSHSITLLGYADQSPQPRAYCKSVLRLFGQKLKSVRYINTYALAELLNALPNLLQNYCCITQERSSKKELIKQYTYDFLLDHFDYLKENPEEALELLADKLYTLTSADTNCAEQDCTSAELQQAVAQFLEISLAKLVWSPYDQLDIWRSVKYIGRQLEALTQVGILKNSETTDALYWTLIDSFCYFLELSGTELNQEFYQTAKQDITKEQEQLWSLPEQEAFITPKKQYLERALLVAHTKARACATGTLSNCITVR